MKQLVKNQSDFYGDLILLLYWEEPDSIPGYMNLTHTVIFCCFNIYFNIILPSEA